MGQSETRIDQRENWFRRYNLLRPYAETEKLQLVLAEDLSEGKPCVLVRAKNEQQDLDWLKMLHEIGVLEIADELDTPDYRMLVLKQLKEIAPPGWNR